MSKPHITILAFLASITVFVGSVAHAAEGEYWEITSKMEVPGMPFSMPGTTQKICIPKGQENNPSATSGDQDCQMSDIQTSGNTTSWKAQCMHDGEMMTGVGTRTTTADGYDGKIQFSGKADGEDFDMTMALSGKKLGGSCDTDDAMKQIQGQVCDTSQLTTTSAWILSAGNYLTKGSLCYDKKEELCGRVRKDAPVDVNTYSTLVLTDANMDTKVAKECGINMAETTAAICSTLDGQNIDILSAHCPAEAKTFRENERRKACEGRKYTSSNRAEAIQKCMDSNYTVSTTPSDTASPSAPTTSNPTDEIIESAKKLKGLFGL